MVSVDPDWESYAARIAKASRWRVRAGAIGAAVSCMLLGAAVHHFSVNAFDWQDSAARARAVLADPQSPPAAVRDAGYILFRNSRIDAELMKHAARRPDTAGDHARNFVRQIQASWR